ncbi:MAG: DNA alkylation repair protein [Chloroflexi bacterium]|nr:DNA alkylation repair protein [Chloroflexota bacterium]
MAVAAPAAGTTFEAVMRELETLGTEQNRKIYKRHGAGDNLFGVSFANIYKLQKRIKADHDLARRLWDTGNADARMLACLIADPKQTTENDLDRWLGDCTYYAVVDMFVGCIAAKIPGIPARVARWTASDGEFVGQAGWDLLAHLAMHDAALPDSYFLGYLQTIERDIHTSKNRTRHTMNNALIAIGIRNPTLEQAARAAARRIGKVEVDHGQTGCKTPDAITYIDRTLAHRRKKAAK